MARWKQYIYILVISFCYLGGVNMAKADSVTESELVSVLNEWVSDYVKKSTLPLALLQDRAESIDQSYAEGGELFFTASADGLKSGRLTFPVNAELDEPGSLQLVLGPDAQLTLAALSAKWGKFEQGVQAPGQEQSVFELRGVHFDRADYIVDIIVAVENVSGSPLVIQIDVIKAGKSVQ